jgi:hypothetical protein
VTTANAGLTPYQALANLSVPRPKQAGQPDDKQVDLVMAGETVSLTDEQAEKFLHFRVWRGAPERPLIRRASDQNAPLPHMLPRALSGRMMGPPQGARPDPEGSSVLLEQRVPETQEPQPGSEEGSGEDPQQDALDIAPRTARARAGAGAGAR